jgi:hypothetical protein
MKKEHLLIGLIALAVLAYLGWPHVRAGYAWARSIFNPQRSFTVDGTAHSGNDSGGVLTQACNS